MGCGARWGRRGRWNRPLLVATAGPVGPAGPADSGAPAGRRDAAEPAPYSAAPAGEAGSVGCGARWQGRGPRDEGVGRAIAALFFPAPRGRGFFQGAQRGWAPHRARALSFGLAAVAGGPQTQRGCRAAGRGMRVSGGRSLRCFFPPHGGGDFFRALSGRATALPAGAAARHLHRRRRATGELGGARRGRGAAVAAAARVPPRDPRRPRPHPLPAVPPAPRHRVARRRRRSPPSPP